MDLILTDLVMPRLGGRSLAEEVARRGLAIPVVFTSGYLDAADAWQSRELPGPLLRKPWRQVDLLRVIRDHLTRA